MRVEYVSTPNPEPQTRTLSAVEGNDNANNPVISTEERPKQSLSEPVIASETKQSPETEGLPHSASSVRNDATGKVCINDTQYFDNVPLQAWEFYIGGYQPAQKWLKDRHGRTLTFDDIVYYQKMIVALTLTAQLMQQVDEVGVV